MTSTASCNITGCRVCPAAVDLFDTEIPISPRFKDVRLRQGERAESVTALPSLSYLTLDQVYNKLCQHPEMRFELKRVDKPHEKIFVLLQGSPNTPFECSILKAMAGYSRWCCVECPRIQER